MHAHAMHTSVMRLGRWGKAVESLVVVVCDLCAWPLGPEDVLYLRSFPAVDDGLLSLREVLERNPNAPSRLLAIFSARPDTLVRPRRVELEVHSLESLGIARAAAPCSLWLGALLERGLRRKILRALCPFDGRIVYGKHHLVTPRVVHIRTGLFVLGVCLHDTVDLSWFRLEVRVHLLARCLRRNAVCCFHLDFRQPGAARGQAIPMEELD
mmetsp:Transcript_30801/g.57541  ORF Transcript_30801/g.57541 Transcript_30801/m.57541 type:complete len:211 (-) Transcript_30801:824-1456(-)